MHSQHLKKHIKMKKKVCLASQEEGNQTATAHTPVSGLWPGRLARTTLSCRERSQRYRRSPKERSSAANPLALGCSLTHKGYFPPHCTPRTREQSKAPIHLPPCQAGKGGMGPWAHRGPPAWRLLAFMWIEGAGSCRQVLPTTLTAGRVKAKAGRKSTAHPSCSPGLPARHPSQYHTENTSPQPEVEQGASYPGAFSWAGLLLMQLGPGGPAST